MMAVITVALGVQRGCSVHLILDIALATALVAITFLDLDHWWVPDIITYPMMVFAAAWSFVPGALSPSQAALGVVPALALWGLAVGLSRVLGREAMGMGDVKLLALIGLCLGAWPTVNVLFLAAVQGAVLGGLASWSGRRWGQHDTSSESQAAPAEEPEPDRSDDAHEGEGHDDDDEEDWTPPAGAVPFGPFLALATLEVMLLPHVFGDALARLAERLAMLLG